jgi:peptide/nickel transport system substrate-binding protein
MATRLARRHLLGGIAAAPLALPRFAIAQADTRPFITVAVQTISPSTALEPLREQSNAGTRIQGSILEPLIDLDWLGNMGLIGRLATSWRRTDNRTMELNLRQGVLFHDGTKFTAEDVVFSFGPQRMWGASLPSTQGMWVSTTAGAGTHLPPAEVTAMAQMAFPGFERFDITDAHTVRLVNKVDDVTLEGRLARPAGSIISRAAFAKAPDWLSWGRNPVGTGPYAIEEYRTDQELRLRAFDQYWGGRPPLRGISFVQVPEAAARINGLLAGQYDFACDIPPDQIHLIASSPKHEVVGGLIANHRVTAFDKTHVQLRDPRVRQAISHAIDRQAIVASLWSGRTRVPKGMQWPFFGPMFLQDWDVPAYHQALARDLLRQASYRGDPIPYRLLPDYYNAQVDTAQVLTEMWHQVGLNVQIAMCENWSEVIRPDGGRGVRDNSQTCFFNDPVGAMASFGPAGQQWASGEWRNQDAANALGMLQSSTDPTRRRAAFRRMLEICEREDPAYTILHQTVNLTAKPRALPWRTGQSFMMDFSSRNWGNAA